MHYAFDTEFIDTPSCSALISLGIAAEDSRNLYMEFDFDRSELTPWLKDHVVPHLTNEVVNLPYAVKAITEFCNPKLYGAPQFWAYYGAYDWYHLARVFGGLRNLPRGFPYRYREAAELIQGIPAVAGAEHNAINDAVSLLHTLKTRGLLRG